LFLKEQVNKDQVPGSVTS